MNRFKVTNSTRGRLLANDAAAATGFGQRFIGLMGTVDFPVGRALHIVPCNSIHTFFMRIAIDAVFLDRELKIVKLLPAMVPWRMSSIYFGAHSVLELPAGVCAASETVEGDQLLFERNA